MNTLIVKGRLTAAPELKQTEKTSIVNFAVAANRRFKADEADFINCTAFGKTADFIANYFKKGKEILCLGELRIDKYTDKQGNPRTSAKMIVDVAEFCGSKESVTVETRTDTLTSTFESHADIDELPF